MRQAHIGLLVSLAEGMPCFLLELLASGRPFAGLRLPQFDPLVKEGVSGRMVERRANIDATADVVADAIIRVWDDIQAGRIEPDAVHRQNLPVSVARPP